MATEQEIEQFLGLDEGQVQKIEKLGFDPVDRVRQVGSVNDNQVSDRESVSQEFGTDTQLPDTTQGRQFKTEEEQFRERNPNVNMEGNLSFGKRLDIMRTTGENQKRTLDRMFGTGNWRNDGDNIIFSDKFGQEHLLDEFGLTGGDIADLADTAIDIGGAIAGGSFGAGLKAGTKGIVALEAIGTFISGSLNEWLATVGPRDANRVKEIALEKGPNAALDFALGLGTAGMGRLLVGGAPTEAGETVGSVNAAIERLNKFAEEVQPGSGAMLKGTVGQRTGNPAFQRIEAIGRKIPFVDKVFLGQRAEQETALRAVQSQLVETGKGRLRDIELNINSQYEDLLNKERAAVEKIDSLIQGQLDEVGDVLSKGGDHLTGESAAMIYRNRRIKLKQDFDETADRLYKMVDELPGGEDKVVDVSGLSKEVDALFKSGLPTIKKGKEVSEFFAPREARAALNGLRNLDNMTLRQARLARSIVWDRMQNANDGIPRKVLSDVYSKLTDSIEAGVDNLPEETAEALKSANTFFKSGIDEFSSTGVRDALIRYGDTKYVENKDLLMRTFLSGDTELIQRSFKGLEPDEVKAVMRGIYNDVLGRSRSPSGAGTDLIKFRNNILSMPRPVLDSLFGVKNSDEIMGVLKGLSMRDGTAEIAAESMVRGDVKTAIREAATLKKKRARDFENGILKPFLRNAETGDPSIIIDELPTHLFSEGTNPQIRKRVISRLEGTPEIETLKKATIKDIFSKATGVADSSKKIPGFIEEGDEMLIGKQLQQALNEYDSDGALTDLLGKSTVDTIRAIAKVRSVSDDIAASTAGGLIAGGMIMKGVRALPAIAMYKLAAFALTNDNVAKAATAFNISRPLGSATRRKLTPGESVASGLVGQIIEDARVEFGDDPDLASFVPEFFRSRGMLPEEKQERTNSSGDIGRFLGIDPAEVNQILEGR